MRANVEGIVMSIMHRIWRCFAAILAAFAATITWAPAAFASHVPPPGAGDTGKQVPLAPAGTVPVMGMPGWEIALIAAGAALAGAALAVLFDRIQATRRGRVTAHVT
jgi:hypothetical protein